MIFFASVSLWDRRRGCPTKKIAALLAFSLLPLAGCTTPYGYSSGPYAGYSSGPYAAYDNDFDQDNYGPPAPYYGEAGTGYAGAYAQGTYGQGAYGQGSYGQGYSGPAYSGQTYYGQSYQSYGQTYAPGYGQSGYAGTYYSAPPPPMRYGPPQPNNSAYYSTYYRCGC